jgi:peptidoglycan hydrolase CwlO-like protein
MAGNVVNSILYEDNINFNSNNNIVLFYNEKYKKQKKLEKQQKKFKKQQKKFEKQQKKLEKQQKKLEKQQKKLEK